MAFFKRETKVLVDNFGIGGSTTVEEDACQVHGLDVEIMLWSRNNKMPLEG